MLFGLANASATFQARMNNTFWNHLDNRVVIYIYNILIYLKAENQYYKLFKKVLWYILEYNLVVRLEKYKFYVNKMECPGYIISDHNIAITIDKINRVLV